MRLFRPVSARRKRITQVLLVLLLALTPVVALPAYRDYRNFQEAQRLHDEAHLCADRKQNDQAIELYERCVALYPYFVDAWTELGELYFERKQIQKAEFCLDQALLYCPDRPLDRAVIQRERGSLFLRTGKIENARVALAEAMRLDPRDGLTQRLHDQASHDHDHDHGEEHQAPESAPVDSKSL